MWPFTDEKKVLLSEYKRKKTRTLFSRFKSSTTPSRLQAYIFTQLLFLMSWLLTFVNSKEKAVRFRVCSIIGAILNEMGETAEIE